jgi:hypothetical protein
MVGSSFKKPTAAVFVAVCSLGLMAGVASPATAGGNSANAKLCQKNDWQQLAPSSHDPNFEDQGACVSFGAHGGVIVPYNPNWGADGI